MRSVIVALSPLLAFLLPTSKVGTALFPFDETECVTNPDYA